MRCIDSPAPSPPLPRSPISFTKSIAITHRHTHSATPPLPPKLVQILHTPVTLPSYTMLFNCSPSNQINNSEACVGVWGGVKKSIVAASRPSQNGRRRSGLKQSRNRSPRRSPTMKWRRRSGSTRPTGAAPTAAPRSQSGRPSTWAWSSVRSVQVRGLDSRWTQRWTRALYNEVNSPHVARTPARTQHGVNGSKQRVKSPFVW